MAAASLVLLVFFGPTDVTARALVLQAPGGEAWGPPSLRPLRFRLHLAIEPDLTGEARAMARMVTQRASPLDRSLVAAAMAVGPDDVAVQAIRDWISYWLPGAAPVGTLPRARVKDEWSVGVRVRLDGSRALSMIGENRWRLTFVVPPLQGSQLDEIRVRLGPGLRQVSVRGFRQSDDGLAWINLHGRQAGGSPGVVDPSRGRETLRLAVEFTRDR